MRPKAAQMKLMSHMSELSNYYYSAGWLNTLEYDLWAVLEGNKGAFAGGSLKDEEIQTLRELSAAIGGWIYYHELSNPDGSPKEPSEDLLYARGLFIRHQMRKSATGDDGPPTSHDVVTMIGMAKRDGSSPEKVLRAVCHICMRLRLVMTDEQQRELLN